MPDPTSSFPETLDTLTAVHNGVEFYDAAYVDKLQRCIETLQDKVGIDGSTDGLSLDYGLRNVGSVNPGHLHSRLTQVAPPAGSSSPGHVGDISWDSDFFYIATGTNTWRRIIIDPADW